MYPYAKHLMIVRSVCTSEKNCDRQTDDRERSFQEEEGEHLAV